MEKPHHNRIYKFGSSNPHICVRLKNKSIERKLFLNPNLHIGEAYMNEELVVEKGSIEEFINLITNCYDDFISNNKFSGSSSVTLDESYKLLGLKKGCSKNEVVQSAQKLQKKIHPDMNRDVKTERLSQLVNEAKEKIIKTDFS